jgi:uncharacterized Zn-finger protein
MMISTPVESSCTQANEVLLVAVCEECGASFSSPRGLRDHKLRHKGAYRYRCSICDQGFLSRQLYTSHKLTHVQASITIEIEGQSEHDGSMLDGGPTYRPVEHLSAFIKRKYC